MTVGRILKKKHNEIYEKCVNDLKFLQEITILRNNFAHNRIEIDNNDKILYFISVANGKESKQPNAYDYLNDKFERLKVIMAKLLDIEAEVYSKR